MLFRSGRNYIAYAFSEVSGVSKFGTYTGNGSTTGPTITTGFRPGFVMIKSSTQASTDWLILDSTRSPFNTIDEALRANLANAEVGTGYGDMDVSDTGFQIKTNGASSNTNGQTYIYMAFKGSYSDYVSPLNDTGTIDSRVKANDAYGFSIASYIGNGSNSTIGHGLSAAPDLAIFKNRDDGNDDWWTYNSISGATKFLRLNTTAALGTSSVVFNDTEPTSTVFTIGTGSAINTNGDNHIAYFFRSVTGYSKIGSYQNNNSTSGVTVTTGFRPAFIILKCTDAAERWFILDNARQVNNVSPPSTAWLVPNDSAAEGANGATTATIDFLDNGFQIKTTNPATGEVSFGTRTYIYMAIADTTNARFNFDASGNKNNWIPNNINSNAESETTYDLMKDTPSLVDENAANFAVLNPLRQVGGATITNGNLTLSGSDDYTFGTIALPSSGKFYYEMTCGTVGSTVAVGVADSDAVIAAGDLSADFRLYASNGNKYTTTGALAYGATYTTGDVIGVACDMTNNTISFYKNNVSQGNAFTDLADTTRWIPYLGSFNATGGGSINFGQRPFAYTPPTGFLKFNTFNLPDSTIEKGDDYFNTVTFSGNGSAASVTGVGFQPDFIWAKNRTNAYNHELWDAIRGVNSDLASNNTSAEITDTNRLVSFDSDGFSYGTSSNLYVNGTNSVAWNWKANGSGSSNTDGSVTATVSANTTAGFSIVGFTAPSGTGNFSAGHGLGVTPAMVIVKTRDSSSAPWYTWQNTFSNLTDDYMRLNATSAKQTQTSGWGAGMTSSVIGLKAGSTTVATENHIAYCFAEVEGYSAFGSYTGNGSTDGPIVYTGFRPAWILVKVATGQTNATSWNVFDTTRNTFNVIPTYLFLDSAGVESDSASTYFNTDILSNGFKIRAGNTYGINQSGATYIYMAFAENPFKNANAR